MRIIHIRERESNLKTGDIVFFLDISLRPPDIEPSDYHSPSKTVKFNKLFKQRFFFNSFIGQQINLV